MTAVDFDALFDSFRISAARLELLPAYAVADYEGDRLEAFLNGRPLPERTILTDPWLARIARTTLAGKTWTRARVVDDPLTAYESFELEVFKETQALGERICVARRSDVVDSGSDFWLFDADTPTARAVVMDYDEQGGWLGARLVEDPATVAGLTARLRAVEDVAVALNEYLAAAHV